MKKIEGGKMIPPVTIKHFQNFQKADNKPHFETPKYVSRTQLRIIKYKKKSIGPHTGSATQTPFGGNIFKNSKGGLPLQNLKCQSTFLDNNKI